jgi:hypothetical protein
MGIARVLFRTIEDGDVLKLEATAATGTGIRRKTTTAGEEKGGGGARDFRFSPGDPFEGIFKKMFPDQVAGARAGVRQNTLKYLDADGAEQEMNIQGWPPTNTRNEWRVARVPEIPPLAPSKIPKGAGLVLALFIQDDDDGALRVYYTTETSIKTGKWDPNFKQTITAALAKKTDGHAVVGYHDFTTGRSFSRG